jgi:hypothetical protein
MKITKQANGENKLTMSKEEWLKIGQSQGWTAEQNLVQNRNVDLHDIVLDHLSMTAEHVRYDKSGPITDLHGLDELETALVNFLNANSV